MEYINDVYLYRCKVVLQSNSYFCYLETHFTAPQRGQILVLLILQHNKSRAQTRKERNYDPRFIDDSTVDVCSINENVLCSTNQQKFDTE
jgi:hypothetical protein